MMRTYFIKLSTDHASCMVYHGIEVKCQMFISMTNIAEQGPEN